MSLMDAWKKWEMAMDKKRLETHYAIQKEMLEAHKAMWGKHDKNNSIDSPSVKIVKSDMLTIQNINKIVGKTRPISNTRMHTLAMARIEDVYEFIDNTYEFRVAVETPDSRNNNVYRLILNRNKIPYPVVLKDSWELSYEEAPNQFIIETIHKSEMRDMGQVIRVLGNLIDRILNTK